MLTNLLFRRAFTAAAAVIVLIAAFAAVLGTRRADAAAFSLQKTLCDASGCNLQSVSPGAVVWYKITIAAASGTVNVSDQLPPGFVASGVSCTPSAPQNVQLGPTLTFSVTAPSTTTCLVNGQFSAAGSLGVTNSVTATDATGSQTASWNTALDLTSPIPGDIGIFKSSSTNSVNVSGGGQVVTYTVAVTNTSAVNLNLGAIMRIEDQIRLKTLSVPLIAQYLSTPTCTTTMGSDCIDTTAAVVAIGSPYHVVSTQANDFVAWHYPNSGPGALGLLKAGDTMTLTYKVKIDKIPGLDCVRVPHGDGLINTVHVALNMPGIGSAPATALSDQNPNNNTSADNQIDVDTGATIVDPACGYSYFPPSTVIKVTKLQLTPQPPAGLPWGTLVSYKITVQNISANQTLTNLQFMDAVQEGNGTPAFWAVVPPGGWTCGAPCSAPTSLGQQHLLSYLQTLGVFKTTLYSTGPGLAPGNAVSFKVFVRYRKPECDSSPHVHPKLVFNYGWILGWTQTNGSTTSVVSQTVQGAAVTLMGDPPWCPYKVLKTIVSPASPPRIRFNVPTQYKIQYMNLGNVPHTVGTVIDTMRISTSNYASQLPAQTRFTCSPTSGTVTGYPVQQSPAYPAWIAKTVVFNTFVQQGVRIIQNTTPVTFGPNSVLTCIATVIVQPPAPSDPFCAQNSTIENMGIMDGSRFYNPNLPYNVPISFTSMVSRPLPKCFDLVPNKTASPLWTYPNGPMITFGVTIHNGSPSDSISAVGPQFVDTLSPALMTVSAPPPPWSCTPTAGPCQAQWANGFPGGGPYGQMPLNVLKLPANDTLTLNYKAYPSLGAPYPPPGNQICNEIHGTMSPPLGPLPVDWFWKHPNPLNPAQTVSAKVCVPVLQVGKVLMKKLVTVDQGYAAPPIPFNITLTCSNGSLVIPASTVTLNANGSATINGIPVGSSCTTTEASLPPPIHPTKGCPSIGWSTPVISPNPLTGTSGGTMTVTVTNHYGCLTPTATIVYNKLVGHDPNFTPPTSATFPITLNCPSGPTSTVTLLANGTAQINNVPVGINCSTTETLPLPITHPACAQVGWFPPGITPNPLAPTVAGTTVVTVKNYYGCLTPTTGGGTLNYTKSVIVDSGYTPPSTVFTLSVQCQTSSGMIGPFTTTITANGSAQVNNIPPGSGCNTTEQLPPPIQTPGVPCQSIGWFPPVITPNPLSPTTNGTMNVAIANHYGCLTPPASGRITVKKLVVNTTPYPLPTIGFGISVQCGSTAAQTFGLPNGGSQSVGPLPANTTCTIAEAPLPPPVLLPSGACLLGWRPVQISPNPVVVPANGTANVLVTNTYACLP